MKKVILVLAITFSGMLFMAGCKKDTNDVQVAMKIKTFTVSINDIDYLTYEYKYDGDLIARVEGKSADTSGPIGFNVSLYKNGRLDSIFSGNGDTIKGAAKYIYSEYEMLEKYYHYYSDTVIITESTHTTNSFGEILKSVYYSENVINYVWENGNCILISPDDDWNSWVINYTYDNEKNPFKDIFKIPSWQEPMLFYSTNNVKSSVTQDGYVIHYNYEYNSNGYPIKATSDGVYLYQYKYEYY